MPELQPGPEATAPEDQPTSLSRSKPAWASLLEPGYLPDPGTAPSPPLMAPGADRSTAAAPRPVAVTRPPASPAVPAPPAQALAPASSVAPAARLLGQVARPPAPASPAAKNPVAGGPGAPVARPGPVGPAASAARALSNLAVAPGVTVREPAAAVTVVTGTVVEAAEAGGRAPSAAPEVAPVPRSDDIIPNGVKSRFRLSFLR